MDKVWTEKELQNKSPNELKIILEDKNLKKSGYKAQLIKRILDSQAGKKVRKSNKSKKEIIPEPIKELGKYLPNGKKYENYKELMNYFLNYSDENVYNVGVRMKKSLERYMKDKITEVDEELRDLIYEDALNVYQEAKEKENTLMKKLYSYPDPKYYNILTTFGKAEVIGAHIVDINGKETLERELYHVLQKEYYFNSGDIVGITSDPYKYPELLIYISDRGRISYVSHLYNNKPYPDENGWYPLPYFLRDGNRQEIENIYYFPFIKQKEKEKL